MRSLWRPFIHAVLPLAAIAALSVLVAGCGGGDGTQASPEETTQASQETTPIAEPGSVDASPAELKAAVQQEDWWYPVVNVDCDAPDTQPEGCVGETVEGVYNPLLVSEITQKWNVCVVIPHLKDAYWVGASYGVVTEAQRDGIQMQLYQAGGYTELATQVNQIDDCVAQGADAVVIGAISYDGLDAKVDELIDNGVVVIDMINGMSNSRIPARALLDYFVTGKIAGAFIAEEGKPYKIAWFPGPPGVLWAERTDQGFKEGLRDAEAEVVATKYGETGKEVQLALLEDTLQASPELDYVAGNGVVAEAAAVALPERGLSEKVKVLASYLTPTTYEHIKDGKITCAVSDQQVITARIAIDMAVRALEKKDYDNGYRRAAPIPTVVCGSAAGSLSNIEEFVEEGAFAPQGWDPVFNVG